jgi:hypothetical protein
MSSAVQSRLRDPLLSEAQVEHLLGWMPILAVAFSVSTDDRTFCAAMAEGWRGAGFVPSPEQAAGMLRIRDTYLSAQISLGSGQ